MTDLQRMRASRDAALSREREANRDWSTAAKSWAKEKEGLLKKIDALKEGKNI